MATKSRTWLSWQPIYKSTFIPKIWAGCLIKGCNINMRLLYIKIKDLKVEMGEPGASGSREEEEAGEWDLVQDDRLRNASSHSRVPVAHTHTHQNTF